MPQLFRILDIQSGPGENGVLNRYWLDNPSGTSVDLLDVGEAFADQHIDLMRLLQSASWEHVALLITEVLTGLSALFTLVGYAGTRSGASTPASNAWSYALKPIGPTLKRGGKRLVGVAEPDTNEDTATTGFATILQSVAAAFVLPIDAGGVDMDMSVVRPVGTPPSSYIVSPVVGAIYRAIGTQVTRKLGRGGNTTSLNFIPHFTAEKETDPWAVTLLSDPTDWVNKTYEIAGLRGAEKVGLIEHTYIV